jgi:hypothetical protein
MTTILLGMDAGLLVTDDAVGFITSDAPIVAFDPERYLRPWPHNGTGLMWPKIEVTCPLSPNHLLLLNRQGLTARLPCPPTLLDEVNRRTRFRAREHYVVRSNSRREQWFKVVEPPEVPARSQPSGRTAPDDD